MAKKPNFVKLLTSKVESVHHVLLSLAFASWLINLWNLCSEGFKPFLTFVVFMLSFYKSFFLQFPSLLFIWPWIFRQTANRNMESLLPVWKARLHWLTGQADNESGWFLLDIAVLSLSSLYHDNEMHKRKTADTKATLCFVLWRWETAMSFVL